MSAVQLEIPFAKERQKDVVWAHTFMCDLYGVTVAEVREHFGMHHGSASSALSALEKDGRLVRLAEKRERCSVYVVPARVHGRPVAPPRRPAGPERLSDDEVKEVAALAFQQGRRNGHEDGLLEVLRFTTEIREVVLKDKNRAVRHDSQCFKEHPECALKAVMLHVQRKVQANAQPQAEG